MQTPTESTSRAYRRGGYGSFRLGLFMPDYFAAVGPLAAAIESLELAENLRNVAFRFDVGERDYEYDRILNAMDWRDKLSELAKANTETSSTRRISSLVTGTPSPI